jgi:Sigma-70 region 2
MLQNCEQVGLLARARSGHSEAFDALCEPHKRRLLRNTYRITRNHEDAEDALQDSFLRAFLHINRFDGRSAFSSLADAHRNQLRTDDYSEETQLACCRLRNPRGTRSRGTRMGRHGPCGESRTELRPTRDREYSCIGNPCFTSKYPNRHRDAAITGTIDKGNGGKTRDFGCRREIKVVSWKSGAPKRHATESPRPSVTDTGRSEHTRWKLRKMRG